MKRRRTGGSGRRCENAARQNRRTDAGERFFYLVRSARRDCWAERNDRPRIQTVDREIGQAPRLEPWQFLLFAAIRRAQ